MTPPPEWTADVSGSYPTAAPVRRVIGLASRSHGVLAPAGLASRESRRCLPGPARPGRSGRPARPAAGGGRDARHGAWRQGGGGGGCRSSLPSPRHLRTAECVRGASRSDEEGGAGGRGSPWRTLNGDALPLPDRTKTAPPHHHHHRRRRLEQVQMITEEHRKLCVQRSRQAEVTFYETTDRLRQATLPSYQRIASQQ